MQIRAECLERSQRLRRVRHDDVLSFRVPARSSCARRVKQGGCSAPVRRWLKRTKRRKVPAKSRQVIHRWHLRQSAPPAGGGRACL